MKFKRISENPCDGCSLINNPEMPVPCTCLEKTQFDAQEAQLQADQKALDEWLPEHDKEVKELMFNPDWVPDIQEMMKEHREAIADIRKEVARETFEEIEPFINHKEDCLIYRQNFLEALWGGDDPDNKIKQECNCQVEALKEKYQ